MARFFNPLEIDPHLIQNLPVAIIGYGNQGHAHALNLRESGVGVVIGLHEGSKSREKAEGAGFRVLPVSEAVAAAEVVMVATPDVPMAQIYADSIGPALRPGNLVLFCHGFNIHYGQITPLADIDVGLVSPKAVGTKLRQEYVDGRYVAALIGMGQDASGSALPKILSYAWGIGARTVLIESSFQEETECDLFGEQAVLCGGIPDIIKAGFETLVEAGYSPEAAYFECLHEAKLITDLIYERGVAGMRSAISDTAQWGGLIAGPRVVDERSKMVMKELLAEIQSGEFARRWIEESGRGGSELRKLKEREARSEAQAVGEELRRRMWD